MASVCWSGVRLSATELSSSAQISSTWRRRARLAVVGSMMKARLSAAQFYYLPEQPFAPGGGPLSRYACYDVYAVLRERLEEPYLLI